MSKDGSESDGEVAKKDNDPAEGSVGDALNALNLKTLTNNEDEFYEEIQEFFEENKVEEALTIEEIDDMASEIKSLRRAFKRAHRELKDSLSDYDTQYASRFTEQCEAISVYIMEAKKEKKKRLEEVSQQRIQDKSKEKEAEETKEKEIRKKKCHRKSRSVKSRQESWMKESS